MQYILTQQELDDLKGEKRIVAKRISDILLGIQSSKNESMVNKFRMFNDFTADLQNGLIEGRAAIVLQEWEESFVIRIENGKPVEIPLRDLKDC